MRKALLLAVPAAALAVAAAASGQPDKAAGPTSAGVNASTQITCGRTRTVGLAYPATGPAASIGQLQAKWGKYFVQRYNASHSNKLRLVEGDTQLPNAAVAVRVAERFASNGRILGVVGPAGSQEVQDTAAVFRRAGLVFISPSATRTSLTTGPRVGYFYRVVPNDAQQGPRVANWIRQRLRAQRVVIVDDQEAYGQGLSDTVERILRNANLSSVRRESVNPATTTDFGALIARIPSNTQVVYTPWQLPGKGQQFGQQLRANGRNAVMFGSDGLFDPDTFKIRGSYVSFFPINQTSNLVRRYRATHGGKGDLFGAPTYEAMNAMARAIDKACRNNQASRAEVRRLVKQTNIPQRTSVLGIRVRFTANGNVRGSFGIYRILANGQYQRVG